MSMDLTGIFNKNEYYTNHYFSTLFEDNANESISVWNAAAKESEEIKTPWSMLRQNARQFYAAHDRFLRSTVNMQYLNSVRNLADLYLSSLGYPEAKPENIAIDDTLVAPVYLEINKSNGAPLLWVILSASKDADVGILESQAFDSKLVGEDDTGALQAGIMSQLTNEDLATKALFASAEPPRFIMFVGMNQIALIDRNKWNEKRYLEFDLETVFSRLENSTLQAMAVLLHKDSLCPDDGKILLDELDEHSQRNASGVSQDLKYALRESIELLGNEVLYDMATRLKRDFDTDPVDANQLTLECLRYMYRMLFVLFIESRPELGYAPIKAQSYYSAYSLESLRDIADIIRDDVDEVGDGYYLHETLAKLYDLIYDGYPKTEEELKAAVGSDSLHDMFLIAPLKAHIFDPEYTKMITSAKLRNSCMLRIIDLMSLTRATGKKSGRRGRISYANLGINQMGAVYEALLSYRGFIAEHDLYEVKRAGDSFNELDVGYFVSESELDQYTEDERVRYEHGEKKGKLRIYEKGTFIYRLAGREREKSASYYTPEVLTKCLVKYALKELLEGKTADDILQLTICEPAMGSAAFLNEAINQLAEAYISRKEQETGEIIGYEDRFNELQKVKMYIADRNVYGIDLNPVAVELAEVSLWLNTIYEGGFVPWFGTQLVNGNSLIGARRQVYRIDNAQATSKGMRWYEMEPERLPFGTARADKGYKFGRKQIYHFLLGDPGMCSYSDKVIKSLEPDNIKAMVQWNKKFIEPITDDDVITLLRLSTAIDNLWEAQIKLRKEVGAKTKDVLSIYGHIDDAVDSHTTIRQKDRIYSELYKSEHMRNAGPYARLKFAMDYWCALWFWPIDKADLLPTRSEFLFDMSLILEGTMASVNVNAGQLSLFEATEMEQLAMDIIDTYGTDTIVDIPRLRKENPRLDLAARIAEQNKFMHWELEFADLFAERGGFDLIVGNPPWIKMEWNEHNTLSDSHPMFAVKKLTATQTTQHRKDALANVKTRDLYFSEYQSISGQQSFLNAFQNYAALKGQQTNLYKCFLPQAWYFGNNAGVSCFVHPNGIFDDPNGLVLRAQLYPRLRYYFRFSNRTLLFADISMSREFCLNIYRNTVSDTFDMIGNLFATETIEQCYEAGTSTQVPGLKDNSGNWNINGHPDRVLHIGKKQLQLFSRLYDEQDNWKGTRLPVLHARQLMEVYERFANQTLTLSSMDDAVFTSEMWHETNAQQAGIIERCVDFPSKSTEMVYSGAHIGLANPLFKGSRRDCASRYDFDPIDLTAIQDSFYQRCNYHPDLGSEVYSDSIPKTPWGTRFIDEYRIASRRMLNQDGERTLLPAIIPPGTAYINTVFGIALKNNLALFAGYEASLLYDFYVKATRKSDGRYDTLSQLPCVTDHPLVNQVKIRTLLLNCITSNYKSLWESNWCDEYSSDGWSKQDCRLHNDRFTNLTEKWNEAYPLRTDYERRQALVELDVLTAMTLGLKLDQLITVYRIQFPVLQKIENDTWYDSNGRTVFTVSTNLPGVGFDRKQWESELKDAPAGKKFYRTVSDDTVPGGPVERIIEYVAPFVRCDREKDYETAWKFFEEKYKQG